MRLKSTITLLATLGTTAFWAASAGAQDNAAAPVVGGKLPKITVSAESFDFGRVPQGASIAHAFWIKNVGEDTLRITDVKPG